METRGSEISKEATEAGPAVVELEFPSFRGHLDGVKLEATGGAYGEPEIHGGIQVGGCQASAGARVFGSGSPVHYMRRPCEEQDGYAAPKRVSIAMGDYLRRSSSPALASGMSGWILRASR